MHTGAPYWSGHVRLGDWPTWMSLSYSAVTFLFDPLAHSISIWTEDYSNHHGLHMTWEQYLLPTYEKHSVCAAICQKSTPWLGKDDVLFLARIRLSYPNSFNNIFNYHNKNNLEKEKASSWTLTSPPLQPKAADLRYKTVFLVMGPSPRSLKWRANSWLAKSQNWEYLSIPDS